MEKRRVVGAALKELPVAHLEVHSNQNRNHNDRCLDGRERDRVQMQNAFQAPTLGVESFGFEEQGEHAGAKDQTDLAQELQVECVFGNVLDRERRDQRLESSDKL